MQIQTVKIINFRGLSEIEFKTERDICVIVGPNAIGKTSILEAIRLAKSVLAPRFYQEAEMVLKEMGAISNSQILNFSSIAGDPSKKVEIVLTIRLENDEIETIRKHIPRLALAHIRNRLGIPVAKEDIGPVQFLSSSEGKVAQEKAVSDLEKKVALLVAEPHAKLHLIIDPRSGTLRGTDLFSQEIIRLLEEILPPSQTLFSYFPADRAMPGGEVTVQIGSNDAAAQMHSHLGNPGTKYKRLKNLLVNETLIGADSQKELQQDFQLIFDSLLYGKRLKSITISKQGALSVLIEEKETGKIYDIDRMSSGEKGLILQFLLMRRSMSNGGLLLIDEPELHLNPAICRQLISFIVEHVFRDRNLRAIICTHSPEIVADAFERSDCRLYHLRSSKDISPVYKEDKAEMFEALRRLGAQTSDVLFSKGAIFVEGAHDAELLEAGFSSRVSGYRITQLRGRSEVEKEIRTIQSAEEEGKLNSAHFFVFDRDRTTISSISTKLVRVLQWDRYCFENYLLDADAVYDACIQLKMENPPDSRGSIAQKMKELALHQVRDLVAQEAYSKFEPENPGFRPHEIKSLPDYTAIAGQLFQRLENIRGQLKDIQQKQWIEQLIETCEKKEVEVMAVWGEKWTVECDGKKVLSEMHRFYKTNVSVLEFKKKIISAMAQRASENWRIVDSYLVGLFK